MKEYLFVYGTLRKDYDLKLKNKIRDDLQYVGQGKVGAYPSSSLPHMEIRECKRVR